MLPGLEKEYLERDWWAFPISSSLPVVSLIHGNTLIEPVRRITKICYNLWAPSTVCCTLTCSQILHEKEMKAYLVIFIMNTSSWGFCFCFLIYESLPKDEESRRQEKKMCQDKAPKEKQKWTLKEIFRTLVYNCFSVALRFFKMLLLLLPFVPCSFVQFKQEILEKCLLCLGYCQRHWEKRWPIGPLPLLCIPFVQTPG